MAALPQPRPGVLDIKPYVGGESKLPGGVKPIKLSSNEGALGPSPMAVAAMRDAALSMHRYPDGGAADLRDAIGTVQGLDPERISVGAGSDELIALLCQGYLGVGDNIVQSAHGFLMYSIYAKARGAETLFAPETADLRTDVDAMLDQVNERTRIVFVANPNNPTGTHIPPEEIKRLRAGLRDDIILVLDAAYAEFVERNDYESGVSLVDEAPNTVMLRTFSKIYGLGGARVGWCYASAHVVDVLNRVRGPFNTAAPAQAAAAAAMRDIAFTDLCRSHNSYWLTKTRDALQALGLNPTDSVCNFAVPRFDPDGPFSAAGADAFLRARGLITRRIGGYGLPNALRISIGREDEMRLCLEALTAYCAGDPAEAESLA